VSRRIRWSRRLLAGSLTVLAVGATSPAVQAAAPEGTGTVSEARAATASYHRLAAAQRDGYTLLTDAQGIACIDNPAGGMGVHYVNPALVGDGKVSAGSPELVVYEPSSDGSMRMVALEYVVFQADWEAQHTSPPELFGQHFEYVGAGNRYGLPPFYELHLWAWKKNPNGLLEDWNPNVSCPHA
jgi:hypothetical protein